MKHYTVVVNALQMCMNVGNLSLNDIKGDNYFCGYLGGRGIFCDLIYGSSLIYKYVFLYH